MRCIRHKIRFNLGSILLGISVYILYIFASTLLGICAYTCVSINTCYSKMYFYANITVINPNPHTGYIYNRIKSNNTKQTHTSSILKSLDGV